MKTSFIQIFDKQDDAERALGFITGAYPTHIHSIVTSSNQVQLWATMAGQTDSKAYGAPDENIIYMVLSVAPD